MYGGLYHMYQKVGMYFSGQENSYQLHHLLRIDAWYRTVPILIGRIRIGMPLIPIRIRKNDADPDLAKLIRFGPGKMMRIRPDPDPQHCIKDVYGRQLSVLCNGTLPKSSGNVNVLLQ